MEEEVIQSREESGQEFKQFLSQYEGPAYLRRARAVQTALEQVFERCRRQREEWLKMARLRLGLLHGLAGEWTNLRPLLLDEEQLTMLQQLQEALKPQLRAPIERTFSLRTLRSALCELQESLQRFNARWRAFLQSVDLTAVNELRDGYNRYYVLEKECAVRSARVARQGFTPLEALTTGDLAARFPLLPVPRGRD